MHVTIHLIHTYVAMLTTVHVSIYNIIEKCSYTVRDGKVIPKHTYPAYMCLLCPGHPDLG